MTRKKLPELIVHLQEENAAAGMEAAIEAASVEQPANIFRRSGSYTLAEKYNLQHLFKDHDKYIPVRRLRT